MATIFRCIRLATFFVLLHFVTVSFARQDDLVISTTHGKVEGMLLSVPGGEVRAFLGIPYGKPPLGKLRFRAPEPVERWEGVKDSTEFSDSCCQIHDVLYPGFSGAEMWIPNTHLSEDCLYLNVWSPVFNKTQPSPHAPVLVWIYGGGFVEGTSSLDIYRGHFLSKSEGVVVVSMNYRVGAFGFLSLPDNKNIRGNAGLLDQRLALKWVANNIAAFGGDPTKVTIFGESAGAGSVGFHLLSPGSNNLFHRAVMQSGSPNAPWGTISLSEAWDRSVRLGKLLDCPASHPDQLEACLQQADPKQIAAKQFEVPAQRSLLGLPFHPVVDGDFLPADVDVLLNRRNLPKKELMIGLNKDEGTYFLVYGAPGFHANGQSLITRKEFLEGVQLEMAGASDVAREAAIFQYTDWTDVESRMKNRDLLGSLVGDELFVCPVVEFAHKYSQSGGKTFLYYFDHRSSINPWPEWMGVMHGYEIEFVFGMPLNPSLGYTKNEVNMTKKFMKHWANFARTGNPGIGETWPMFTAEQRQYVTLNSNPLQLKGMMKARECQLWNKVLPQIQKVSDGLQSCLNASGIILRFNDLILLLLLVISVTC
ncbi:cholinesterase-like [Leuresthes tenuis]|uniref:cholinesterase-like n=1 Tax=Leuresthes tenuis TaxID=355514 RepID=UPI003B5005E5